jgi:cell division septation protein DedD
VQDARASSSHAPRAEPTASGSGPLALVPQGDAAAPSPAPPPPAAPAPRTRTAAAPNPAPAPIAPTAIAPGNGGYAVQVSSQRSEAEALAAFKNLQSRFPNQLSGREMTVRRADLGSKGVYYRAMVGPLSSMEEAAGLCSSIKAAGGNCIVQKI